MRRVLVSSAAVPQIAVRKTEYAITAAVGSRRLAHAVRTVHGWHMPTSGRNRRPEWQTYDDTQSAATGVYLLAVARAHSRSSN